MLKILLKKFYKELKNYKMTSNHPFHQLKTNKKFLMPPSLQLKNLILMKLESNLIKFNNWSLNHNLLF